MLRVFVTHDPEDRQAYYGRALPDLRSIDGVEVVLNPLDRDLTTAELAEHAAGCHVVVAHRSTPGDAALFAALPELLAFLRTAVDISTIDVAAASDSGVLVAHADKSFVASTAELALALTLDLLRNVTESTLDYRAGVEPPQRPGRQLRGRTAGIIGFGAIGSYLAGALRGLGVHVLVHDPQVDATTDGFEQTSLDDLLGRADIVLPLAASTPATHHIIGARALALMQPGSLLVNVSRGELLDETAVAAALDAGHLGGLAMDVGRAADQRPSPRLASRPGVVATPHLGGLTPENADAQAIELGRTGPGDRGGRATPRAVNAEHATRLRAWWAQ